MCQDSSPCHLPIHLPRGVNEFNWSRATRKNWSSQWVEATPVLASACTQHTHLQAPATRDALVQRIDAAGCIERSPAWLVAASDRHREGPAD